MDTDISKYKDNIYTYAIDKSTGVTYVGKSEIELKVYDDKSMVRPKNIQLSKCGMFETLKCVRDSNDISQSFSRYMAREYESKRALGRFEGSENNVEVSLEDAVIRELRVDKITNDMSKYLKDQIF
ncbi:MAG: hypothetical protein WC758_05665 [Candidatus Woesearchaeota archaeon]|jgi:hypothetical protein